MKYSKENVVNFLHSIFGIVLIGLSVIQVWIIILEKNSIFSKKISIFPTKDVYGFFATRCGSSQQKIF
jgi:hypothetical protein